MSYNINNSLVKTGIIGEQIAKYFLCNIHEEIFIKFNHDYKFDIETYKGTYEIKTDLNYIKYNSLFCEFESKGQKSGIETTESKYYIFVCPNNKQFEINYIYIFKTGILKEIIKKYNFLKKSATCKDYNNNEVSYNKGYIIPIEKALKYCKFLKIVASDYEDLSNIIKELI